jgi:hypothetical protein
MHARYYDPQLRRFISSDPVEASLNSFNRYVYANNSPYVFLDPDGQRVACAREIRWCMITSDTFVRARSNGQTSIPSGELRGAAVEAVPKFTVTSGPNESLGYFTRDANGGLSTIFASDVGRSSNDRGALARSHKPNGALGVIHGHIDGSPRMPGRPVAVSSDGMVDRPDLNYGYGDTESLTFGIPTATVSHGYVGWHEIDHGQLIFTYPLGALSKHQEDLIQTYLNSEQYLFLLH